MHLSRHVHISHRLYTPPPPNTPPPASPAPLEQTRRSRAAHAAACDERTYKALYKRALALERERLTLSQAMGRQERRAQQQQQAKRLRVPMSFSPFVLVCHAFPFSTPPSNYQRVIASE